MEITDHIMLLYLHERRVLCDFERIQRLLQVLGAKGYAVLADAESEPFWLRWREWSTAVATGTEGAEPMFTGFSPQAVSAVEQFCAKRQLFLMLQEFAVAIIVASRSGKGCSMASSGAWGFMKSRDSSPSPICDITLRFAKRNGKPMPTC
jgi:hypothetical protein